MLSAELEIDIGEGHSGLTEGSTKPNVGVREGFLEEVVLEPCLED